MSEVHKKAYIGGEPVDGSAMDAQRNDVVNPYKNELWRAYDSSGQLVYHKPKTVENCLIKYGMAKWNRGSWNSKNKIDVGFVYPNASAHVAGKVMPEDIVDLYQLAKEGKLSLGNTSHHWEVVNKNEIPQHFIDVFKRVIEENRGAWNTYNYILSGNQWNDNHWALHWNNTRMHFGDIAIHVGTPRSMQTNSLFSGAYFTKFKVIFSEVERGNIDLWAMAWAWSKVDKWELAYLNSDGGIVDLENLDKYGPRGDLLGGEATYFGFAPKYLNKVFYKYEGESPWFINWDQLKSCDYAFVYANLNNGHLQGYNKIDFQEIPANTWRLNAGNYYSEDNEETKRYKKWGAGVSDGAFWQAAFLHNSNISKVGVILDFGLINADRFQDRFFGNNLREIRIKNLNGIDYDFTNQGKWGNMSNLDFASIVYLMDNVVDLSGYIEGQEWRTKILRPNQSIIAPAKWLETLKTGLDDSQLQIKRDNMVLKGWSIEFR